MARQLEEWPSQDITTRLAVVSKLENARWVVHKEQELFDDIGRLRRPDIVCVSKDEPPIVLSSSTCS